jgi:antitoxin VapB
MSFHVRDPETDRAVRRLAQFKGKTLTETIREAVEHEYAAVTGEPPLLEKIRELQAEVRKLSRPGGLPADKAFYDELSGDP